MNDDKRLDNRWVMLADDLTGGCDAGVQFAECGLATRVYLEIPREAFAGLSVIVTHSRNDRLDRASLKVRRACQWISDHGATLCFKKIDSTLQGNLGAELEAVRHSYLDPLTLIAPSFPAMGRLLIAGRLRVGSAATANSTHLPSLLSRQGAKGVAHISHSTWAQGDEQLFDEIQSAQAGGARRIVVDVNSDADLRSIARVAFQITPMPLLVGSAGLACHWSRMLTQQSENNSDLLEPDIASRFPVAKGSVIVCTGSTNPITQRQLKRLLKTADTAVFDWRFDKAEKGLEILKRGDHLLIQIPRGTMADFVGGPALARFLREGCARGLLLCGGDTAKLICNSLGVKAIQLERELMTGLPFGRLMCGQADRLPVCTKAGGFGGPDAVRGAVDFLARCLRRKSRDVSPGLQASDKVRRTNRSLN
jgi:D-threonate/D-erythronate kinase